MKKKWIPALPFLIMPVLIPFYWLLDKLILVDVFGCGCVPSVQENMLGIAFNSNDLRLTVFAALAIGLSIWSIFLAKIFKLDMFPCGVASLANIGGSASAPILAGAYSGSLVPVGVLMALMGYVIGTGGGILVANIMSMFV